MLFTSLFVAVPFIRNFAPLNSIPPRIAVLFMNIASVRDNTEPLLYITPPLSARLFVKLLEFDIVLKLKLVSSLLAENNTAPLVALLLSNIELLSYTFPTVKIAPPDFALL